MVYRIYVEKKPGFDVEANGLKNELTSLLGIKDLTGLRLLNRYDVEGIDEALFNQCVSTVFSEPPVDNTYAELPAAEGVSFAVEYLPGQFDQRAASAAECIQLISQGERPLVRSARVYLLEGALTPEQVAEIKKYVINPVEAREASLETKETLKMDYPVPAAVAVLEGFNQLDEAGLAKFIEEKGLAMDLGDINPSEECRTRIANQLPVQVEGRVEVVVGRRGKTRRDAARRHGKFRAGRGVGADEPEPYFFLVVHLVIHSRCKIAKNFV